MTLLPVSVAPELVTGEFRKMIYADLREVILIEHRAYEFCWTEGIFRDCLRAGYYCQVLAAPNGGRIQGYGIMSALRTMMRNISTILVLLLALLFN